MPLPRDFRRPALELRRLRRQRPLLSLQRSFPLAQRPPVPLQRLLTPAQLRLGLAQLGGLPLQSLALALGGCSLLPPLGFGCTRIEGRE